MLDITNLAWPETPFGADRRPFGRQTPALAAFAFTWTEADSVDEMALRSVATVYLRVLPAQPVRVTPSTLPVGFRVTVVETPADCEAVLGALDRALVRARRHAHLLAGQQLDVELGRLDGLSVERRPGIDVVRAAWADRATHARGLARLHDTADGPPDVPIDPDQGSASELTVAGAAFDALVAGLAVGLTAGHQASHLRWEGSFAVHQAVATAAWDLLARSAEAPAR